jgi:hypothetical protein
LGTAVSLDCNFLVGAANEKKALFFLLTGPKTNTDLP